MCGSQILIIIGFLGSVAFAILCFIAMRNDNRDFREDRERREKVQRDREKGFTLIEVLIVAAIVGIMAAMVGGAVWKRFRPGAHTSKVVADKVQATEVGIGKYGGSHSIYYVIAEDGTGCSVGLSDYSRAVKGTLFSCRSGWYEVK